MSALAIAPLGGARSISKIGLGLGLGLGLAHRQARTWPSRASIKAPIVVAAWMSPTCV